MNKDSRGICFILSAPAGTGKTTLVDLLKKELPRVAACTSYTTRKPRSGERDGEHYKFIDKETFEKKIKTDDFLEYVTLYGEYYGTDKRCVEKLLVAGKHVFLVIDTQGALKLKKIWPSVYIFVSPPSLEVLRERLTKRRTETTELIEERLLIAEKELKMRYLYDYQIINDNIEKASEVLKSIVIAEEHKTNNFF